MANSVPDIQKIIQKELKDLERIRDRVLPVKVGRAVRDSVRENFRQGGFYGDKWQTTKRQEVGFNGVAGQYGPLLSRQNHLRSSTDYVPGKGEVAIRNTADYAKIHNEGGEIPVTKRMKSFFWVKAYQSGLKGEMYGRGRGKINRIKSEAFNGEFGFWKSMALKKVGSRITIPKRQFMGDNIKVTKTVDDIINKELQNHINGINNRRSR